MSSEIAIREETAVARIRPREVIEQASEEADALASVIEKQKLFSVISGRRYVRCEGWTTLAALRGFLPREVGVHRNEDGSYEAVVELVRIKDGTVLSRASAECGGPTEAMWQNRADYARRSMAVTRATGKVCRIAFSWVMAMSGYEVTPLEEMPMEGEVQPPVRPPMPEAHPERSGMWMGFVTGITKQEGTNKATGKPWTLFKVTGDDGYVFGTFSQSFCDTAEEAKEQKARVRIEYKQTPKGGKDITSIELSA